MNKPDRLVLMTCLITICGIGAVAILVVLHQNRQVPGYDGDNETTKQCVESWNKTHPPIDGVVQGSIPCAGVPQ